MKKLKIIIVMVWFSSSLYGQNMINGGFEQYAVPTPLPLYTDQIEYATGWHTLSLSPDLFHTATGYPLPSGAGSGTYLPRTGAGHGHFWSMDFDGVSIESLYGTTDSLAAGQTYTVSFWIMNSTGNPHNFEVQAYMSHTVPNPSSTNPFAWNVVPQISCVPTGIYEKYTFCYTATQGGKHYLSIGSFNLAAVPNRHSKVDFNIDDVSVAAINSNDPNTSVVTMNSQFCLGNTVTADGSGSTGELEHKWEVYRLSGTAETLISSGSIQPGAAGTFDVTSAFAIAGHTPSAGNCYRIYLTTYSNCPARSHADFCYDNPATFNFIHDGNPVCENEPLNLQVTGDDGWTYDWSSGQNGVGLKSVQVTPTAPSASYSVTVTTPAGCTFSRTLNLVVHSSVGQVAPSMDGINGTHHYTIYANAGLPLEFTSFIYNNAGEIVTITESNNLPSGYNLDLPNNLNGGTVSFSWTPIFNAAGNYFFTLHLKDNNGCNELENTYTFHIIVICEYCPVCISYNNRTPASDPLPAETKAGQCIVAGNTGEVIPGDGVLFQAGQYIILDSLFDTQAGIFEAVIDPSTCVTDCEDCCVDFEGFTLSVIPDIFSPNGDGSNDFWQIMDLQHPFCAYNATSFELYILNRYGTLVYKQIEFSGKCCGFTSPSVSSTPDHASIFWDGKTNTGMNQGQLVSDGTYFFVLYIHGCGGTIMIDGPITVSDGSSGIQLIGDESGTGVFDPNAMLSVYGDEELIRQGIAPDALPEDRFFVFPNPTDGLVHIHGGKPMKQVQVLDINGKVLFERSDNLDQPIDLGNYSAGKYQIRVTFTDNQIKQTTVVKQ